MREALTEAFSTYGEVVNIRLPTDRDSGEMKGIGFIEFADAKAKVCGWQGWGWSFRAVWACVRREGWVVVGA